MHLQEVFLRHSAQPTGENLSSKFLGAARYQWGLVLILSRQKFEKISVAIIFKQVGARKSSELQPAAIRRDKRLTNGRRHGPLRNLQS